MQPKVFVIILNWNNDSDTLRCLRSVFASDYPNLEVVVVDNGSRDESVNCIKLAFPELALIQNGENLGFTGGNNVGIEYALGLSADYVLLLNNDAVIAPQAVSILVQAAQANPGAGFLGPKIRGLEEENLVISAGGVLTSRCEPLHRGCGELDRGQFDQMVEVDYLSGCALLVSKKAIQDLGFLDSEFFFYFEDVEWCVRGRKMGYGVQFVPSAIVWHPDTRQRPISPAVTYYTHRNQLLFARKIGLGSLARKRLFLNQLRTLLSWSLLPRWREHKKQRDVLAVALLDFALGRFGKAGRQL